MSIRGEENITDKIYHRYIMLTGWDTVVSSVVDGL